VRIVGEGCDMFKQVLVDSPKWEMARAPNEVCVCVCVQMAVRPSIRCSSSSVVHGGAISTAVHGQQHTRAALR
jgi:hypothetical protein